MSRAQVYFIFGLFFALIITVFALQNPERISINILFWEFIEVSQVMVILASTVLGALVVVLLGLGWQIKKFMYIRQLEGEIRQLRKTLGNTSGAHGEVKNPPPNQSPPKEKPEK